MNVLAIHQAMRLETHPEEMACLCSPESDLPEGISDLLRLCSAKEQLIKFAINNGFKPEQLSMGLFNFIEKAIVNEKNSDEKILGCDQFSPLQLQKIHYQLLIKAYHPDLSDRPNTDYYSKVITMAYQRLKEKRKAQETISFSEDRRPLQRYYQTTKKAEVRISNTKTAIATMSVISIFILVAMAGKLYDPANPNLISINTTANNVVAQKNISKPIKSRNIQVIKATAVQTTSIQLQILLKDLETAYEEGNIDIIKPILANAPEIKHQTDKQLNEKLVNLFKITTERKMLLFNFNWTTVTRTLEGKGRFLSRYKLVGEKKWLIREGTALITAKSTNKKLKITQFMLKNKTVE